MNVAQLINPLRLGPDGKVVITNLPESLQLPRSFDALGLLRASALSAGGSVRRLEFS
jgi:hypothetical protein